MTTNDPQRATELVNAPVDPPLTHARLDAFTHNLAAALHQSLDPATVISLFLDRIRAHVRCDGFRFVNRDHGLRIEDGRCNLCAVSYRLTLGDQSLGELLIARERAFQAAEAFFIEGTIAALLYPLRNALLYHAATRAAFKDPLTGVNNRTSFPDALEREARLAQRYASPFSVVMLDIDHFKAVNDRHGHIVGDAALCTVSRTIETCLRATDVLFRYGGEEFVALLPNTDQDGARRVAERMRAAVESEPCRHRRVSVRLSVSIGVASLRENEDGPRLFERVDESLYVAKREGRNRVAVAAETGVPQPMASGS